MSIPTPSLSHLTADDYEHVYEPAEDSFLLLDALEKQLDEIIANKPVLCVEVGGGSGVISAALSLQLPSAQFLVTDVNPFACQAIQATAKHNNTTLHVVRTSALDCLDKLQAKVDVLLCNPPYVATHEGECGTQGIAAAWAGGFQGNNLTKEIIERLHDVLSEKGEAFIVLEQCNKPENVMETVEKGGLKCKKVIERRAGREFLTVIKIYR